MKYFVAAAIFLVVVLGYAKTKMTEHSNNTNAAEQYLHNQCAGHYECKQVLADWDHICVQAAYSWSVFPGSDKIDVQALVDCVNRHSARPVVEVVEGGRTPFPSG